MRTFFYTRGSVKSIKQENQLHKIRKAGYEVKDQHVFTDTVSGSVLAMDRKNFQEMLKRMDEGDRLVVSSLDRLGRDSIDVEITIKTLIAPCSEGGYGIELICLELPVVDLTSDAGMLFLKVLGLIADIERRKIVERTRLGLERAKAEGKKLGRKPNMERFNEIQALKQKGLSQYKIANKLGISRASVAYHWHISPLDRLSLKETAESKE